LLYSLAYFDNILPITMFVLQIRKEIEVKYICRLKMIMVVSGRAQNIVQTFGCQGIFP
jgi:hypothetical protein